MGILSVALLLMGWDGVVDEGLDIVLLEVYLQAVTLVAEDGEEVVDVVLGDDMARQTHERVGYTFIIEFGNAGAVAVVVVELEELGREHGGLQLIDATVVAGVAEHVLLGRAVVAQGTYYGSQLVIVGSDATGIAQCTEVLTRIEAVSCGVAERTGAFKLRIENSLPDEPDGESCCPSGHSLPFSIFHFQFSIYSCIHAPEHCPR